MKKIGLLILALIILAASCGGYAYLMYEINVAIDEIAFTKTSVDTIGKRSAAIQASERFLTETKTEQEALRTYVIRDADVVRPIEAIEEAAREEKVDVDISSAHTQSVADWNHHETIRLTFSGTGSYMSLVHLASALETLPFAARLERVTFEVTADEWFATYALLIVKETTQ
jgi:hypothetical protein